MTTRKITIALSGLAILAVGGYLYLTSGITSLGYEIADIEKELAELREQEGELVVRFASYQSPDYLLTESQELGLVEVKEVSGYIDGRASAFGRVDSGFVSQ